MRDLMKTQVSAI